MSDMILKARVRKRDKDIRQAVSQLHLEEGEMADMVRDGFRKMLAERGVLVPTNPVAPITKDAAQIVAKELMRNLRIKQ